MKKILVNRILENRKFLLTFEFGYHPEVLIVLQRWEKARFSNHLKMWVVLDEYNLVTEIFGLFKGICFVDITALRINTPTQLRQQTRNVTTAQEKLPVLEQDKNPFLNRYISYLKELRYSSNTIDAYLGTLKMFLRFHHDVQISDLSNYHVHRFNKEYILTKNYSRSYQNQVIKALKHFIRITSGHQLILEELERPKKSLQLPVILSIEEIQKVLTASPNLKHKALLSTVYGCGLRMGDVLGLRLSDIDRNRGIIHLKNGKGAKDRLVPLPKNILEILEEYYRQYRPKSFVFEGKKGGQYTSSSVQKVLKRALFRAGVHKQVTLHTLRHSYATHLLEAGVHLRTIQEILGHKSPNTTQIYTYVSNRQLSQVRSPIEDFNLKI